MGCSEKGGCLDRARAGWGGGQIRAVPLKCMRKVGAGEGGWGQARGQQSEVAHQAVKLPS